jgi:cation diffusion facilitator CzcD-associated flavoprotein CzcO
MIGIHNRLLAQQRVEGTPMNVAAPLPTPLPTPLDVIIVGAGISGIGMAAHLKEKCPQRSFVMLDRRDRLGGTWDLFRYPGVRSDSDMYTLGFAFAPWRDDQSIADGDTIRSYLDRVVDERSIRQHIRFGQDVIAANWDSAAALWTVTLASGEQVAGSFLFLGSGYYDYDNPHDAQIAGLERFGGTVVHPQFWPDDLGTAGKRVVVIGSGATAVSLIPALAESAAHVTMLQRTPTWYINRPKHDRLANLLRRIMPEKWAYALVRERNTRLQDFLFSRSRAKPKEMGEFLTGQLKKELGEAYSAPDFTPPYGPWEQRLCLVPDGDMFRSIREGRASVVTGEIATVDESGVLLKDGQRIDADVIVTATGLRLVVAGKIAVSLDGKPVNFAEHFYYRNCMFSNVPNLAALFGYLNAGWTLRVDIVADWLCRLFNHMDAGELDVVTPELPEDHGLVDERPFEAFSSGYLQRSKALIPRSATTQPWRISMDYRSDRREMREAPVDDGVLRFGRVGVVQQA